MSEAKIKSLRSELSALQELLPELSLSASRTAPSIHQCPSRLRPAKLARDLPPASDTATDYVDLLELTVDRLQYLVQCSVCILGTQSPPLSLLSAVRKLSQLLTKDSPTPDNPPTYLPTSHSAHPCRSVASQTYETAFTNCMNCLELQNVLVHVACLFAEGLQPLGGESRVERSILSSLDLDSPDLLSPQKWAGPMQEDVVAFSSHLLDLQKRAGELERNVKELSSRLFAKSSEVRELQTQLSAVNTEAIRSADLVREELEREREDSSRERHALSVEREQERIRADKLQHDVSTLRQDLTSNSATVLLAESRARETETALRSSQREAAASVDRALILEQELQEREKQRESMRVDMEARSVAVRKLEVQVSSLRQHEAKLQSKCESLLEQVLGMEEELIRSQQELSETAREREQLDSELANKRTEISELKIELAEHINSVLSLEQSAHTHTGLVESLRDSLNSASAKLEAADQKCRLLMRFSNPTDSCDASETQDLISANSVRIMLIEEHNSKLRERSLASSLSSDSRIELVSPTPLWHMRDLSTLREKYSQLALSQHDTPNSASDLTGEKSRPKSLGRCGQLLEALSRARSSESVEEDTCPQSSVTHVWAEKLEGTESNIIHKLRQIHTCAVCDKMFHDESSLLSHTSHCH